MQGIKTTLVSIAGMLAGLLPSDACERFRDEPLTLPSAVEARAFYESHAAIQTAEIRGNVVELQVRQPPEQLRRGGTLWAKVGPYIYLLSPSTRELFEQHGGVAAVRVVTLDGRGEPVAQAMLLRDALNDLLWRRTLNILGHAVQEGTQRPTRLEDLVAWGERHTEYWYNPAYVPE